ncbi:hypothetical protein [Methanosphaera cuniculi]|uniref:hypothetical protein n=1 Tax=Methanosphaera cuniculi TaxID=1077256 RepID=UPI0026EB78BE|nr:hypothetical protein [Methanosphaera cuniculi]
MKNNQGYITTTLILLMIIPAAILILITLDQNQHHIQQTSTQIENDKLTKTTQTYKDEITQQTQKAVSQVTQNQTKTKKPLKDAKQTIQEQLQKNLNTKTQQYQKTHNIQINCIINQVKQTNDPFTIKIDYTINATNKKNQITQTTSQQVTLENNKYPIYDPQPFLKAKVIKQQNEVRYKTNPNLTSTYTDAYSGYIIHKCPYADYHEHANSNQTFKNCLKNHYYHISHDGLCLFCRMENKTTCPHNGLETFIIPVFKTQKAITSIDHVLFNQTNQYNGQCTQIDDNTYLYLDKGHKNKYGLL